MGVQFVGCHRNGLTGEISTPSGRGPGHGISHAGREAAMWFQVPTPQTTSRSTSSRRSILKRDESLPIAPRDWVSFDATARRSTVPPDTSSRWLVALVHRQCTRSPRFCRLTFAAGRTGQPGRIPRAGRRENRSRRALTSHNCTHDPFVHVGLLAFFRHPIFGDVRVLFGSWADTVGGSQSKHFQVRTVSAQFVLRFSCAVAHLRS